MINDRKERPAPPRADRASAKPSGIRSYDKPTNGKPGGNEPFTKPAGSKPGGNFEKPGARPSRSAGGFARPAHPANGTHRPAHAFGSEGRGDRSGACRSSVHRVKPKESDGLAARRVALEVIRAVTEQGKWASLVLNAKLTKSGLSPEDRRLVSRLVYDTLENMLRIDWVLDQLMAKPDTDIRLRNILRLGACQLLFEDRIPDFAATNTSVNLCRENEIDGLAGVCNGILRNLIRRKDELVWPNETEDPVKARSIRYSVPEWLVRRFDADLGSLRADSVMAARPMDAVIIRRNAMKLDEAAFDKLLAGKVWEREAGLVPGAVRIRGMADLGSDADYQAGAFSMQSESSMLACLAVAPKRGQQVLDACAAPGGKACFMAEMMDGTGRVQAWELHPVRTELIAAQARRLGLENVRPMTRDASLPREDLEASMDAVLLDAPCSGTGNLADKPDMKLRLQEENVAGLAQTQRRLLDACAPYVKRGGTLVYSTCSVLKEENADQIAAFLERHPEFEPIPMPETFPERFRRTDGLGLQLLQGIDGMGGFYIARLRRRSV